MRTFTLIFVGLCGFVGVHVGAPVCQADDAPEFAAGYSFERRFDGNWPKHATARLTLRNPKKLRPLFIVGNNVEGPLRVELNEPKDIDDLLGEAWFGRSTGSFSVTFSRYSAPSSDLDRHAATQWLTPDPRPELELHIAALTDWRRPPLGVDKRGRKQRPPEHVTDGSYDVKVQAALEWGGKRYPLTFPARVRFRANRKVNNKAIPHTLVFNADFETSGAKLGLSGADAGPMRVQLTIEGYSKLEQAGPSLDVFRKKK